MNDITDVRNNELKSLRFLQQLHIDKNLAVSFSGGKDSLVALDLCIKAGIDKFVFSNTTIEFEETIKYINTVENYYGINIDTVRAKDDFFDLTDKIGFPSRRMRWCCDVFKFGPLSKYAIDNSLDGYVTGLRRGESKRRNKYSYIDNNPMVPIKQINPLLDWDENSIWEYIEEHDLPTNPLYEHFDRVGCWCCPYKSADDWKKVKKHYPWFMDKLEKELDLFADKIGITDKENFIKNRKWTGWATSQSKMPVGTRRLCSSQKNNMVDFAFFGDEKEQIKKIVKVLPILTADFHFFGKALRVTVNKNKSKRLNTLIEKAVNCVGCGACVAVCPSSALYIDHSNTISVNPDLCNHCERCLNTQILKGACIVRNYAIKRGAIINKNKGD